jgi:hypothetical protein
MTAARARAALLGLALLGGAGCEQDVDYGYFAVKVTIDQTAPAEWLTSVASCGVNVDGADVDFGSLACAEGSLTGHELGVFEWSTSTSSGAVQFTVTFKNALGRVLGAGKSPEVNISPGQMVMTSVVVVPTPESLMPPPGGAAAPEILTR